MRRLLLALLALLWLSPAWATIAYVGNGGYGSSGTTTLVLTKPASTVNGNLVVGCVAIQDSNGTATISTPSGWNAITNIVSNPASGAQTHLYGFWTIAAAGTTYSFTGVNGTGTLNGMDGVLRSYSGTASAAVVNGSNTGKDVGGGVTTVGAITETFASGEWYVGCATDDGNAVPTTINPALSNVYSNGGSYESFYTGDYVPSAAPASESYSILGESGAGIGFTIKVGGAPPPSSCGTLMLLGAGC